MPEGRDVTRRALLKAAAGATAAGTAAGCTGVTTPADLAQTDPSVSRLRYFVDAAHVAERRDDLVVLDARSRERFRAERIYGARHVDFDRVTARKSTPDGLVPDAKAMAGAFADAGVRPDDDVVVYGSSVGSRVTRVVFALEYLGHRGDRYVLDGGFEAWIGRIGTGDRSPPPAEYDPSPDAGTAVTRSWLAERLESFGTDDGPVLLDVRAPEAYLGARGAAALVASNDRHGHLPGAMNVHWVGNVAGRHLKDPADLAELYFAAAGIAEDDTVVVYGQGNVNATNTYAVLRALGVSDVRVYEGGFGEWANVPPDVRDAYPVETKTRAVVEAEGAVGGSGSGGFSCTG